MDDSAAGREPMAGFGLAGDDLGFSLKHPAGRIAADRRRRLRSNIAGNGSPSQRRAVMLR